jgi:hypothetical protein
LLQRGERRRFVGFGEEATALEEAGDTTRDGEHEACDVVVGWLRELDEGDAAGALVRDEHTIGKEGARD